jgi:hypothetical protein
MSAFPWLVADAFASLRAVYPVERSFCRQASLSRTLSPLVLFMFRPHLKVVQGFAGNPAFFAASAVCDSHTADLLPGTFTVEGKTLRRQ